MSKLINRFSLLNINAFSLTVLDLSPPLDYYDYSTDPTTPLKTLHLMEIK